MDISAVLLYKLLEQKDLECWGKLKLAFLDPSYSSVYSAVHRFYDTYSYIPSFEDLETTLRDSNTKQILEAIKLADIPEVDINIVLDAVIDSYTQNETIKLLDKFIDKLPIYDTEEIKENLASVVLSLDEKTISTEGIYTMNNIHLFKDEDEVKRERIPLGINNTMDATIQTMRQEYILVGGTRGSGKSIVGANIVVNQYLAGKTSVYFTIEMSGYETLQRIISILSGVDYQNIRQNKLSADETLLLVKTRAAMFEDSDDLVLEYITHRDRFKFESDLLVSKELKPDNQIVIIDDRALSLTNIDIHLSKLKAKFGDNLTVSVVDYINQIRVEGKATYDWQPQIDISTGLKNLARKYDILMFSPYQIDASGEARFAKGILDAADIAFVMKPFDKEQGAIGFQSTKLRSAADMVFTSPIDWSTLAISPNSIEAPEVKEKIKKAGKSSSKTVDDSKADIQPWDD